MLRITELKLPLDHSEADLKDAILKRLGIKVEQLVSFTVFRQGHDARKKSEIYMVYTLDVDISNQAAYLAQLDTESNIAITPDTTYKFVAQAPEQLSGRPIVIGMGPCGLFVGLILAQMGFNPIILERGKEVRERTKDTFGLWRKSIFNPESNVQFGEVMFISLFLIISPAITNGS